MHFYNSATMISIIIPTYNREDLIQETLDSILAQSETNWECLLIDDGSTDQTWNVLQNYSSKDDRFKIFKRQDFNKPKGANACRNIGIKKSNGDFLLFLDSDDLLGFDFLSSVKDKITNTKNDLIIYQSVYFFENNSNEENIVKINSEESLITSFFKKESIWLISNPLIKRAFIAEKQIFFNENLLAAQDWEFFMKILLLNPKLEFNLTNQFKVKIRKHLDNISQNPTLQPQKYYHYYKARHIIFNDYLNAEQKVNLEEYYKEYSQKILYELIKMMKFNWAKEIISNESNGMKRVCNLCFLLLYTYTKKGLSKILLK